jgi:hypothetical protein
MRDGFSPWFRALCGVDWWKKPRVENLVTQSLLRFLVVRQILSEYKQCQFPQWTKFLTIRWDKLAPITVRCEILTLRWEKSLTVLVLFSGSLVPVSFQLNSGIVKTSFHFTRLSLLKTESYFITKAPAFLVKVPEATPFYTCSTNPSVPLKLADEKLKIFLVWNVGKTVLVITSEY